MGLTESTVESVALEWFRRRTPRQVQGYGVPVGDQPSPQVWRTGLRYAVGHGVILTGASKDA